MAITFGSTHFRNTFFFSEQSNVQDTGSASSYRRLGYEDAEPDYIDAEDTGVVARSVASAEARLHSWERTHDMGSFGHEKTLYIIEQVEKDVFAGIFMYFYVGY